MLKVYTPPLWRMAGCSLSMGIPLVTTVATPLPLVSSWKYPRSSSSMERATGRGSPRSPSLACTLTTLKPLESKRNVKISLKTNKNKISL